MEQLQYRIRDEHHHAARVSLQKTWLEQENLVGEATVRYDHSGRRASFTCHFDIRWRPPDSSYYLYTDEGRR